MTHRGTLVCIACGFALLVAGPVGEAAARSLTVTGTTGRDDLDIRPNAGKSSLIITPAAATSGDVLCDPVVDPVSGRQTATRCNVGAAPYDLTVDVGAGNDSVRVNAPPPVTSATVFGGAGDDNLEVSAAAPAGVRGGDGNDVLSAPANAEGSTTATFDGGAGRDLVDYLGVNSDGGVVASLAAGSATILLDATRPTTRTDSLTGVERLSGTRFGDVLTGGPGADELAGNDGPDVLDGAEGADSLLGGDGSDSLQGGAGTDSLDGGDGIDDFKKSLGGDTLLARDGAAERLACFDKETVVDDLADGIDQIERCGGVSTAQAKHKHDTRLQRRALRASKRRVVRARVACPKAKTERCAGVLRLRLGGSRGRVLAARRYRLGRGRGAAVGLRLTAGELRRARGRKVTLEAREVDSDGRGRRVLSQTRLRR
jgi:hypothetical protein